SIIIAIVAVVATVLTAGALAQVCVNGLTGLWSVGLSTLASNVGIALAAGAVGSIAGQLTGMALGVQDEFSWGAVAAGALGAAATAGLPGSINVFGDTAAGQIGNAMVGAAARSVVSQGINIVTGQQKSFNWASVAVSAVSAPLSQSLSGRVEGSGPWASLARSGIGALTSAGTRAAIMGGGFSWEGVAGDALSGFVRMDGFGNASGNSIGDNSTAVGAANSDSDLNAILDGVPDLLRGERIVLVDAGGRTSDVSKGVIGSDRVQLGTTDIDVFRINDGAEALQGKFPDFPATAGQWRAAVAANMDRLDLLGEANGEAFIRDVKRRNNEVPDFMRSGEPEDGYANVSADGFQYDASQPRQALSGYPTDRPVAVASAPDPCGPGRYAHRVP
ncbi:MAG TPA: hypothetical protein PKL28_10050, partial [Rhodocyclaceae bacterium]|nr:hypothetical protein [Rhodocyclaceae bacterium]